MHSVILAMPYVYVTKPFVGQMSWKIKFIKLYYALQFSSNTIILDKLKSNDRQLS
jgi:hypothetical protein